jgi:predicted ATPase/Tfp pilus assembly protein PilF
MSTISRRIRNFRSELKRRKVFRVALMYGVVAWLLIQVAETTFPVLDFPLWTVRFVIVAALLGLPVALVLSWAYELRPEETLPTEATPSPPALAIPLFDPTEPRLGHEAAGPVPVVVHRLPPQSTPFVGRERDLRELQSLIATPTCRLITICGPGGVGKTRFALQGALAAADTFEHGAAFVPLNDLSDGKPLVATIAERLGLPLSGRGDARAELLAYLREKQLLVVMDNFEHLTESSALLAEMLESAPRLKLLVTTRERLGLYGETLFSLDGLTWPESDGEDHSFEDSEAVRLFLQSARRVQPYLKPDAVEVRTIARICQAVDGLPLAIELAAAWVRAFPYEQILREIQRDRDFLADTLRGVPERHRSMRAAFEYSWRLLSDGERRVFRRLSVFRGGFAPEAAAEVAGASVATLSALLDKSLVRRSVGARFEVLEVLRQYAEEKLREDADEYGWVRQHHCSHYTELLEALSPSLGTTGEKEALDRIAEDVQNVRQAWQWAAEHRLTEALRRSLQCIFVFHEVRGRAREGWDLLCEATEALGQGKQQPEAERLTLLRLQVRRALFGAQLGQTVDAGRELDAAITRLRSLDEPQELSFVLDRRGVVAYDQGAYDQTREFCTESLSIARTNDDRRQAGWALMHLGNAAFAAGDYTRSEQLHQESLAHLEVVGDQRGIANCHRNLGIAAGIQGRLNEASESFQQALSINRKIGNPQGIAGSLQNLGHATWQAGRYGEAEIYLQEAVVLAREIGLRKVLAGCLNTLGNVAYACGDFAASRGHYHQALATAAESNDTPAMLEILLGIARLLGLHEGRPEAAARLLTLVLENPASDHDTRTSAEKLRQEFEALLSGAEHEGTREPPLPLDAAVAGILGDGAAALWHGSVAARG